MALTVTSRAAHRGLASLAAAKELLQVQDDTAQDALLANLLGRASDAIERYCRRPFARESVTETVPGYGDLILELSRRPLVRITSVTYTPSGEAITDAVIEDAGLGWLYREKGWLWTTQRGVVLTDYVAPNTDMPNYSVTYVAGYLVPDDNVEADTLSVAALDQSVSDSASGLPILQPGDTVTLGGFTTAANNGRFTVVTSTATKVTLDATTLVDEAAGGIRQMAVSTLPGDLEQACLETVKSWFYQRSRDSEVQSRSVGDLSVTYATASTTTTAGPLPFAALRLLQPWVAL